MLEGLGTGAAGRRLHRKLPVTIHKVEKVPVVELKYKTTLALRHLPISPQELCEGGRGATNNEGNSRLKPQVYQAKLHPFFSWQCHLP